MRFTTVIHACLEDPSLNNSHNTESIWSDCRVGRNLTGNLSESPKRWSDLTKSLESGSNGRRTLSRVILISPRRWDYLSGPIVTKMDVCPYMGNKWTTWSMLLMLTSSGIWGVIHKANWSSCVQQQDIMNSEKLLRRLVMRGNMTLDCGYPWVVNILVTRDHRAMTAATMFAVGLRGCVHGSKKLLNDGELWMRLQQVFSVFLSAFKTWTLNRWWVKRWRAIRGLLNGKSLNYVWNQEIK